MATVENTTKYLSNGMTVGDVIDFAEVLEAYRVKRSDKVEQFTTNEGARLIVIVRDQPRTPDLPGNAA